MKTSISRRDFLKTAVQTSLVLGVAGNRLWANNSLSERNFDLIIKNGTVIDGIQNKGFKADIGIIGERIKAMGNFNNVRAKTSVDASGKVVSPGFVDIHAHTDLEPFLNPKVESNIRQGVTTELNGNCGFSAFPLNLTKQDEERRYAERLNLKIDWTDLQGYHSRLEKNRLAVNHATLIGHGL